VFFPGYIRNVFISGAYCKRRNCFKRRARNPTTTLPFDYCSLKCLRLDRTEQLERGKTNFHFSHKQILFLQEEREMEQSLVPLNSPTTINSISTANSVSTNDSTIEQQNTDDRVPSVLVVVPTDDVMDLLRAIEMSRLQSVRENEQNIYRPNSNHTNAPSSILSNNDKMDYFNDLQQAIELSLRPKNEQQQSIPETTGLLSRDFQFIFDSLFYSSNC
jgi:hypothetical protein